MTDRQAKSSPKETDFLPSSEFTRQIDPRSLQSTLYSIDKYNQPHEIDQRLRALSMEWGFRRAVLFFGATTALLAYCLAWIYNDSWIWPLVVLSSLGLMIQEALMGWSLLNPVLRTIGFRSEREIDIERLGLKIKRGYFQKISPQDAAEFVSKEFNQASA